MRYSLVTLVVVLTVLQIALAILRKIDDNIPRLEPKQQSSPSRFDPNKPLGKRYSHVP